MCSNHLNNLSYAQLLDVGTCSSNFCLDSAWQATSLSLMTNFRSAVLESSVKVYQQTPKPLTRGAFYMIYVLLVFVFLAVAGSSITVYEFLQNSRTKKTKPDESSTCLSKKSLKTEVWKQSQEHLADKVWVILQSFLRCFCVLNNGKKLLSTASNKNQFECINGIRFLSNFWVILLHICMGYMSSIRNIDELKPLVQMWSSQLVLNRQYAVDAFFVLSGFLNAYLFFDNYNKSNGDVSWLYFYLKRFLRLTPVYMVVLGFQTFLFPYLGSGPLWPTFATNKVCSESWWWNMIYINNFRDYTKQCMEWCWYLAADMQFYIFSPIFLISLIKNPRFGYILTGTCIFASCFANFILTKKYNLVDGFSRLEYHFNDLDQFFKQYWMYFDVVYIKPYTRISSHLVAILLAHYLYKIKLNKIKFSQGTLFFGWIATCLLWFIAYFGLFKRKEYIFENALYNGIKHLFYSIGFSWIIFACLSGKGGYVNKFLSLKVFYPLARISYCAFLIHPIVLMRYYQTAEDMEDLNVSSVFVLAAYVYFWTYVFSVMTTLLVEFPILNIIEIDHKKQRKNSEYNLPDKSEL